MVFRSIDSQKLELRFFGIRTDKPNEQYVNVARIVSFSIVFIFLESSANSQLILNVVRSFGQNGTTFSIVGKPSNRPWTLRVPRAAGREHQSVFIVQKKKKNPKIYDFFLRPKGPDERSDRTTLYTAAGGAQVRDNNCFWPSRAGVDAKLSRH